MASHGFLNWPLDGTSKTMESFVWMQCDHQLRTPMAGPDGSSTHRTCNVIIRCYWNHYNDVIMSTMTSQITSHTIVFSTVYLGGDQRNHQSSASLAIVREIHRSPVISMLIWPVTRKMFPFDDVIMPMRTSQSNTEISLQEIGVEHAMC